MRDQLVRPDQALAVVVDVGRPHTQLDEKGNDGRHEDRHGIHAAALGTKGAGQDDVGDKGKPECGNSGRQRQ